MSDAFSDVVGAAFFNHHAGEGSAWLRGRIAQLLQLLDATTIQDQHPRGAVIVIPLGRSGFGPEFRSEIEDHTCDRCRTHQPDGIHGFVVMPRRDVMLAGGLCDTCVALEEGQ